MQRAAHGPEADREAHRQIQELALLDQREDGGDDVAIPPDPDRRRDAGAAEQQRRQIKQRDQGAARIAARPRARALGEHQREMQEQRRQHQHRHHIGPIEDPIERVEPAAEGEGQHAEKGDAQPEEVQGGLMLRPPQPDRRADQQRENADRRQREIDAAEPGRHGGDRERQHLLRPQPQHRVIEPVAVLRGVEQLHQIAFALDPPSVHRDQDIARLHAGPGRRRAVVHDLRGDPFPLRPPEHAVLHLRPRRANGDVRDGEAEQRDDDGGLRHEAQPGRTAAERVSGSDRRHGYPRRG